MSRQAFSESTNVCGCCVLGHTEACKTPKAMHGGLMYEACNTALSSCRNQDEQKRFMQEMCGTLAISKLVQGLEKAITVEIARAVSRSMPAHSFAMPSKTQQKPSGVEASAASGGGNDLNFTQADEDKGDESEEWDVLVTKKQKTEDGKAKASEPAAKKKGKRFRKVPREVVDVQTVAHPTTPEKLHHEETWDSGTVENDSLKSDPWRDEVVTYSPRPRRSYQPRKY